MSVSEQTSRAVVREDAQGQWELWNGRLREKPAMGTRHNDLMAVLATVLGGQLDWCRYRLRVNAGRVRRSSQSFHIPDLYVVPIDQYDPRSELLGRFELYEGPLPLVIEIWSPSTGDYGADEKIPDYMLRGDREIWRFHPFDRTLTTWVRLPDDSSVKSIHRGGVVRSRAVPDLEIDLDRIFNFR